MKNYRISFCTVCMNRLHHIRQTLPKNIEDNKNYPNTEFVLLDFNSTDGLEEWVKAEMSEHIASGILVYYKNPEPKYFDRSLSRNQMFKLASGELICNIDADNYTGTGFADYINSVFNENANALILPDTKKQYYYMRDCIGRFCAKKEDFLAIAGYDETMSGYGFEDDDLYARLNSLGRDEVIITDLSFLKVIKHGDEERTGNEFYANNLDGFYIYYMTPTRSEVLFLYKNGTFEKGIVNADDRSAAVLVIEGFVWKKGSWSKPDEFIRLTFENGKSETLSFEESDIKGQIESKTFYKITNQAFLSSLGLQLPLITNQGRYFFNKKNKQNQTNPAGFGRGKVYKNLTNELISI